MFLFLFCGFRLGLGVFVLKLGKFLVLAFWLDKIR